MGKESRVMLRKGQWLVDMESPIYSGSGECQRSRVGMEFELGDGGVKGEGTRRGKRKHKNAFMSLYFKWEYVGWGEEKGFSDTQKWAFYSPSSLCSQDSRCFSGICFHAGRSHMSLPCPGPFSEPETIF